MKIVNSSPVPIYVKCDEEDGEIVIDISRDSFYEKYGYVKIEKEKSWRCKK